MYAVIEDSGTQIKVAPGDVVDIDLRDLGEHDKTIQFDRVLLLGDPKGDGAVTIGTPYVDGAAVTAEVMGEIKADKIDVIKFKRRKGYRRKQGHRQRFLRVKIAQINAPKKTQKPRKAETQKN